MDNNKEEVLKTEEENANIVSGTINTSDIKPKMRQIIIETDGTNINISKMEVAGVLEYKAILTALLDKIK